jgi:hypothetical protein
LFDSKLVSAFQLFNWEDDEDTWALYDSRTSYERLRIFTCL